MPRPLGTYPSSVGAQSLSVFPHVGPAVYVQVGAVVGTVPAVGGDRVLGVEAGLKNFDVVDGGLSDDGIWSVVTFPLTPSAPAGTGSSILSGIPKSSYGLKWISQVTALVGGQNQTAGQEAVAGTNLSAFTVRLTAQGI